MLETGSVRLKNTMNIMLKNLLSTSRQLFESGAIHLYLEGRPLRSPERSLCRLDASFGSSKPA